jgi:hypothetical protein
LAARSCARSYQTKHPKLRLQQTKNITRVPALTKAEAGIIFYLTEIKTENTNRSCGGKPSLNSVDRHFFDPWERTKMFTRHLMKVFGALVLMVAGSTGGADAGGCLRCYKKTNHPAQYSTTTDTVVVKQGHYQWQQTPPTCTTNCEQVTIPGRSYWVTTPPVVEVVAEKVLIRPERVITKYIPPKCRVVCEKVEVAPAATVWRKKHGLLCEVATPARYKTVCKKVEVEPGHTTTVTLPAVYATRYVKKIVSPGTKVEHFTPSRVKTVCKKVWTPGTKTSYWVPPVTKTVTRTIQIAPATTSWDPVSCPTCGGYRPNHHHHHGGHHHGGYAPSHGGYAPAHGGHAPAHGGYAPAHGGYAPAHGGYAPAHGGYGPPSGGYTTPR